MTIINLRSFKNSFKYAASGLKYVYRHEQNFRIQLAVGALVFLAAYILNVSGEALILLILLVVAVILLELINTVLEYFLNVIEPKIQGYAKIIKDIMAGVVLIMSLCAAVVGILIFWPYIF